MSLTEYILVGTFTATLVGVIPWLSIGAPVIKLQENLFLNYASTAYVIVFPLALLGTTIGATMYGITNLLKFQ